MIHPKFTKTFSMGGIGKSSTHKKNLENRKTCRKVFTIFESKSNFSNILNTEMWCR